MQCPYFLPFTPHSFRLRPTDLFCSLPCSLSLSRQLINSYVSGNIWHICFKRQFSLSFIRNCASASKKTRVSQGNCGLMIPVPLNRFCSVALHNNLCNGRCCFKLRSYISVNSWKAISVQQRCHHVILKTLEMRLKTAWTRKQIILWVKINPIPRMTYCIHNMVIKITRLSRTV